MKDTQFKIGDKIKFTPERIKEFDHHSEFGVKPGQIYTVTSVSKDGSLIFHTLSVAMPCTSLKRSCILVKKPVIIVTKR